MVGMIVSNTQLALISLESKGADAVKENFCGYFAQRTIFSLQMKQIWSLWEMHFSCVVYGLPKFRLALSMNILKATCSGFEYFVLNNHTSDNYWLCVLG